MPVGLSACWASPKPDLSGNGDGCCGKEGEGEGRAFDAGCEGGMAAGLGAGRDDVVLGAAEGSPDRLNASIAR